MNESKNYSILYHYIPMYNFRLLLEEYIKTGKFLLKTNSGPNQHPVISLSRNPSMYSKDLLLSKQLCRISIDGSKLSENYKIIPYADSTYTKGSDNEQEEMLFVSDHQYNNRYDSHVPSRFQIDIKECLIQIDILSKSHKLKDEGTGYVSWVKKWDEYNPKYFHHPIKDDQNIQNDHSSEIQLLFELIKKSKIDVSINVVSKFVNYKYQSRYIDNWNKNGFKINNFKKFENLNESVQIKSVENLLNTLSKENLYKLVDKLKKDNNYKYRMDVSYSDHPMYIHYKLHGIYKLGSGSTWVISLEDNREETRSELINDFGEYNSSILHNSILDVIGVNKLYKKINR